LGKSLAYHVFFLANWYQGGLPSSLRILWSISVEEQFYILFPLTFVFARRAHPALLPAVVGLVAVCASRYVLAARGHDADLYFFTITRGDQLLLGALLAQCSVSWPEQTAAAFRRVGSLDALLLVLTLAFLAWPHYDSPLAWTVLFFVSAILAVGIVGSIGLGEGPLKRALEADWVVRLGQRTYAAYVFHMYAMVLVWAVVRRITVDANAAAVLRALLVGPPAFFLAELSWRFVERRVLRLRTQFTAPAAS
jgi:peptidoglycan/LPS O-acetylase OafA/YrhL